MAILKVSETTMNRLRQVAARREQSIEELAEEALAEYLAEAETVPAEAGEPDLESITAAKDAWFGLVGLGSSGYTDTASRMREVMDELTHPHDTWSLTDGGESLD